jgi:hypothetical protein
MDRLDKQFLPLSPSINTFVSVSATALAKATAS